MAKENKPRQSEKISADCPHCGFSQLESAYAKSTFCRKCGQHYSIEKLLAREAVSLKTPGFSDKLTKLIVGEPIRDVTCFSCGHRQTVSASAQSTRRAGRPRINAHHQPEPGATASRTDQGPASADHPPPERAKTGHAPGIAAIVRQAGC